jgi:hypothetical protein
MAMTKEEQKAAARRIMEKYPMTEEERVIYEQLIKKPEDYRAPTPEGLRVCGICGAEFQDVRDAKGVVVTPALGQFADHQASHNPSPAAWTEAYNRIQSSKAKAKKEE